jgi:hypothetical protein
LSGDLTVGSNKTLFGVCDANLAGHIEINGDNNILV